MGTASLSLGEGTEAVPLARDFVRRALAGCDDEVVEAAQLVVTELVTNAVLHGVGPVALSVEVGDRVRVAVEDAGHELPVLVRASSEALTGRGLALVSALAETWGIEPGTAGGKAVWAELPTDGVDVARPTPPEVDVDALLAAWEDDDEGETTWEVRLGAVPTSLLLAAKAQIDNLVREFSLAAASGHGPSPHLASIAETVQHSLGWARAEIKRQAVAAAARGDAETELVLRLPATAADAGERYLAALDEADLAARAGHLLTLETPRLHRVFRHWYVRCLVDQLRARAAGEQPGRLPTFQERLAEEVTALAHLEASAERLGLLQRVTSELTGARTVEEVVDTVTTSATEALGAASAAVYLLDGDVLRAASNRGGTPAASQYGAVPVSAPLPGGEAVRTRRPVVVHGSADLERRFPALAGLYAEERSLHVAPLVVGDHVLGVLSLSFRGTGSVDQAMQTAFVTALGDACAQAAERASATARAAEATERLAFLAEASVLLSSSVDYRATLASVAGLVVPRLADWCAVQLLQDGVLQTVALTHVDPERIAWAERLSERYPTDMSAATGAPEVVRSGRSLLWSEVPEELLESVARDEEHLQAVRELGMTSALVVPLAGRSGVLGAITMICAESGRRYGPDDVAFAEDLARRAALAVETAHAFREQSGRLDEVRRIAEAAQHAILAPPPPVLGPVALSARYVSAAAEALIGGDLYEVVVRPGAVRLVVGDVRGKGLAAVRTATVVLGEFRAAAADLDDLHAVATQIDRRLRPYLAEEDFVTALLAEVRDDGGFTVACCGHPPALLASGGTVTVVEAPPTLPLGLGASPQLATGTLAPGDRLLLHTDGLVEARAPDRRFVDVLSLLPALLGHGLEEVLDEVLAALHDRVGPALGDDLALLVAEYRGT